MNAPVDIEPRSERLRLRVEDFLLLAGSGAFDRYAKTELIDGDIYAMNAQLARHARVKLRLALAFLEQLRSAESDLDVLSEVSVRATSDSMPEPDVVLTRWRGDDAVPIESVALIAEVADTTLATDLGRKAALYAAAGVPEYWVVDLSEQRLVIHVEPVEGAYGRVTVQPLGATIVPVTLSGVSIDTAALLG